MSTTPDEPIGRHKGSQSFGMTPEKQMRVYIVSTVD